MILRTTVLLLTVGGVAYFGLLIIRLMGPAPQLPDSQPGRLADCPNSPNCVCTQTQSGLVAGNKLPPIPYHGSAEEAIDRIKMTIERNFSRATLVRQDGLWLRYQFNSLIVRFVDDVEFLVDDNAQLIHFRSASRVGHSDLGANRKRMQRFAEAFANQK